MASFHYVFIRPTQINGINYAVGAPADAFDAGTMESLIRACRITVGEGGGEKLKKPKRKKPAVTKVEPAAEVSAETEAETEEQMDAEAGSREDAEGGDEEGDDEELEGDEEADDDALSLKQLGVGKKFLEGFASANVTTLGEARAYLAEHKSFEKLPNIGEVSSRDLVAQLGL